MSNVIKVNFGGEPPATVSHGAGVIVLRLDHKGVFGLRCRGELSHMEKVGMLTMALHTLEFEAMNK